MKRLLLGLLLLLAALSAQADTPVTLFRSVAGNVNFVGGEVTMRRSPNTGNPCQVWTASDTVNLAISGIPATATIKHAQLYWAASGTASDFTVTMDGVAYTALSSRQYTSTTIGSGFTFFSGAVDVTAAVTTKRNNSYALTGLTVNNGSPWCASSGVLGGFSMVVVYSDTSEPFRVLNLYEGFQYLRDSSVTLTLSNFQIPSPLTTTGRVAHVTWEGDNDLLASGENLTFNGTAMVDGTNPSGNQFNSKSNIDGSSTSYGVDFDAYTVASPVIQANQTSASTIYATGQDLVLLSAEIIAVPNVAAADLEIFMTRNDALVSGQNASYTLSVVNNGPSVETGPVVVVNTLPAKLTYVSAAGAGWSCGASGQVVTCSRSGNLAVNATASPITLTVLVNATGSITNTATVDGVTFDNISANSTASDTSTATAPIVSAYIFTNGQCVDNIALGAGGQTCAAYAWPTVGVTTPTAAGTLLTNIFITAVNASGVPTKFSASAATPVNFEFALRCNNPTTANGTLATFTALPSPSTLPTCASNAQPTTWSSAVSLSFAATKPSVATAFTFDYDDVGRMQFYLRGGGTLITAGAEFKLHPDKLSITNVKTTVGNVSNPGTSNESGTVFAKAGEIFGMNVGAYTAKGNPAKNFGRETTPETLVLTQTQGSVLTAPPATAFTNTAITGSWSAISNGVVTGSNLAWSEVGSLLMTPAFGLGAASTYALSSAAKFEPTTIGRFYPDHFDTVVTGPMACLTNMLCGSLATAVYSSQPFAVQVTARNGAGGVTTNYNGKLAKAVTLGAFDAPASLTANPSGVLPPTPPSPFTLNTLAATAFAAGVSTVTPPAPVYQLRNPYVTASPHANNWTAPVSIYIRATETSADGVTSKRTSGTVEGGVRVLQGRLLVGNVHGSERLKMTVPLISQYWTGSQWEKNTADSSSVLSLAALVSNCQGGLVCPISNSPNPASKTMAAGATSALLLAPNQVGYGDVQATNPAWLPSTVGRISFGVYRSPLIYIREVF